MKICFTRVSMLLALSACSTLPGEVLEEDLGAADSLYAGAAVVDQGFLLITGDGIRTGGSAVQVVDTSAPVIGFTFATPRSRGVSFDVTGATAVEIQKLLGNVWRSAYVLARGSVGGETRFSGTYTLDGTYRIIVTRGADKNTWIDAEASIGVTASFCVAGSDLVSASRITYAMGPISTANTRIHLLRTIATSSSANTANRARIGTTLRFTSPPYGLSPVPNSFNLTAAVTGQSSDYIVATKFGADGVGYELHYQSTTASGLVYRVGTSVPVFEIEHGAIRGCARFNSDGGVPNYDAGRADGGVSYDAGRVDSAFGSTDAGLAQDASFNYLAEAGPSCSGMLTDQGLLALYTSHPDVSPPSGVIYPFPNRGLRNIGRYTSTVYRRSCNSTSGCTPFAVSDQPTYAGFYSINTALRQGNFYLWNDSGTQMGFISDSVGSDCTGWAEGAATVRRTNGLATLSITNARTRDTCSAGADPVYYFQERTLDSPTGVVTDHCTKLVYREQRGRIDVAPGVFTYDEYQVVYYGTY